MASAQYEEALDGLREAQRRECEMNDLIDSSVKDRNKKNEQLADLNRQVRNVTYARTILEKALKECEEIRDYYFPNMQSGVESASTEYAKTFDADFVSVSLQSVYEEDLSQTKGDIEAVFIELQEQVKRLQSQETELNGLVRRLKNDISGITDLIGGYVKKRNSYSSQVEEYTSLVRYYQ